MTNLIEVIETPFDLAHDMADLAFRLDEGKFALPCEMHPEMRYAAEVMYDAADMLAGDRKDELYGKLEAGNVG